MTQDQLIILLFRILLVTDLASVILFLVVYTVLASWWKDVIGRTIAIKDILLGFAFIPSVLSLFFHFNRLTSHIAAWFDVGIFAGIAAAMLWRSTVWIRVHRKNSNREN